MGKFIHRSLDTVRTIEQDVVSAPQAVTTFIEQKITNPVIIEAKSVAEPIIQYIDREVEVIKEVPVTVEKEVIKFVEKEVVKFIDRPVHIFKEKIIEIPVEKITIVEKDVIKFIHKAPNWIWYLLAFETLTICMLIIK